MLSNKGTFIYTQKKERIVVCLVGVINRSIKHTWFSIYNNIIKQLEEKYLVDIALFNNDVENTKVDGVKLNNDDLKIIPYNYLFKFKQTYIDKKISKMNTLNEEFPPYWYNSYKKNGLRHMYMESIVGKFLKKSQYKIALVSNGDHLYVNKFELGVEMNDGIISCNHLDMRGYTNGFYFGYTKNMIKILDRINYYDKLIQTNTHKINYEQILKRSFQMNNIKRFTTDLFFIKIRGNKAIQRFGMDFIRKKKERQNLYLQYLKENKDKDKFYKYLLSIYK